MFYASLKEINVNQTAFPRYSQNNIAAVTRLYVNAGQTLLTAIPVGVEVQAGDEGTEEVTATGAQTADPGKTHISLVNLNRLRQGGRS